MKPFRIGSSSFFDSPNCKTHWERDFFRLCSNTFDKLHRLEKLGYLPKLDDWQALRVIRNRFAHDYPEDDALKAAYLNEAISAVPLMHGLLAGIAPVIEGLQPS